MSHVRLQLSISDAFARLQPSPITIAATTAAGPAGLRTTVLLARTRLSPRGRCATVPATRPHRTAPTGEKRAKLISARQLTVKMKATSGAYGRVGGAILRSAAVTASPAKAPSIATRTRGLDDRRCAARWRYWLVGWAMIVHAGIRVAANVVTRPTTAATRKVAPDACTRSTGSCTHAVATLSNVGTARRASPRPSINPPADATTPRIEASPASHPRMPRGETPRASSNAIWRRRWTRDTVTVW